MEEDIRLELLSSIITAGLLRASNRYAGKRAMRELATEQVSADVAALLQPAPHRILICPGDAMPLPEFKQLVDEAKSQISEIGPDEFDTCSSRARISR